MNPKKKKKFHCWYNLQTYFHTYLWFQKTISKEQRKNISLDIDHKPTDGFLDALASSGILFLTFLSQLDIPESLKS